MDLIRIPSTATDEEVQRKLDQLYSKEGMKEKKTVCRTTDFDRAERTTKEEQAELW